MKLSNVGRAITAARNGAWYIRDIITACEKHNLPIAAGMALIQKETGFRNVWGHDRAVGQRAQLGFKYSGIADSLAGEKVKKKDYLNYKRNRSVSGAQGVGPAQLTFGGFQDQADKLGGCWKPAANIMVGVGVLAGNYHKNMRAGMDRSRALQLAAQAYNGSGPAAEKYGRDYMVLYDVWRKRFNP